MSIGQGRICLGSANFSRNSFLPKVEEIAKVPELCDRFSSQLHIPSSFWGKSFWDANGFFGSQDNPIQDNHLQSHCKLQQ